jgi:hypothetical protein
LILDCIFEVDVGRLGGWKGWAVLMVGCVKV